MAFSTRSHHLDWIIENSVSLVVLRLVFSRKREASVGPRFPPSLHDQHLLVAE
jgi:hypothetical protein